MAEIKSESVADFIPESVAGLLRNQQLVLRRVNFVRFIRSAWVYIADKIYTVHFKRIALTLTAVELWNPSEWHLKRINSS